MTTIAFQSGGVVLRDGKVGIEQECCCVAGECSGNSDCCVCVSTAGYFDANGNPLDCAGLGAGWENIDGSIGNCIFVGNESFPCPQSYEELIEQSIWCNQKYPDAAAIDSFEPAEGGFCCSGVCQKSCDEADPP